MCVMLGGGRRSLRHSRYGNEPLSSTVFGANDVIRVMIVAPSVAGDAQRTYVYGRRIAEPLVASLAVRRREACRAHETVFGRRA